MNNPNYCANCRLHGWKKLEDTSKLQRCKSCKVIQYCGRDCQREHWKKIHKEQCQLFTSENWGHKEANCLTCRQARSVGKNNLMIPNNPHYECILKVYKVPHHISHPHTFPLAGMPGDNLEKAILVLWHLLHKCVITRHWVARNCGVQLEKLFQALMMKRISIWEARKVFPYPQNIVDFYIGFIDELTSINDAVESGSSMVDSLELWKIIWEVIKPMIIEVLNCCNNFKALKDPLAGLPDDMKELVSQSSANQEKYLAVANEILDALAFKVIPYGDILKIICGGSLTKNCSFCSKKIIVAGTHQIYPWSLVHIVFFSVLSIGTYSCGSSRDCFDKSLKLHEDLKRLDFIMCTIAAERQANRCDFCLRLPPKKGSSYCSRCGTTMYCSETCHNMDWKFHKNFCSSEDVEERKKKFGPAARKKAAKEGIAIIEKGVKKTEKEFGSAQVKAASEVVEKFKLRKR